MNITAAILCGGQGTRIRPVLGDIPKCLAPIAGRPFLEYLLTYLSSQEIENVVLCLGVGAEKIINGDWKIPTGIASVRYSVENTPLGTGGALKHALPLLASDPVLAVNGDTFHRFNLTQMLAMMRRTQFHVLRSQSYIKERPLNGVPNGCYLLSKKFLNWLPEKGNLDEWLLEYEKVERASGICNYHTLNSFFDIGTPENYKRAEEFLIGKEIMNETF